MAITVNQIIMAAWSATIPAMLNGQDWLDWDLNEMAHDGRLKVVKDVKDLKDPKPREIMVPIVWTKADVIKQVTENQKIKFACALLENSVKAHDNLLAVTLDEYPPSVVFQVTKLFRYNMSTIEELESNASYLMKLSTIFTAGIPT